jgi:hypothetical protein
VAELKFGPTYVTAYVTLPLQNEPPRRT